MNTPKFQITRTDGKPLPATAKFFVLRLDDREKPDNELLPGEMRECPFCGGHYLQVEIDAFDAAVQCGDCNFLGPKVDNPRGIDPTQNAIDKWNERSIQRL